MPQADSKTLYPNESATIPRREIPNVGFVNTIQEILNEKGNIPEEALHHVLETFNTRVHGEVTFIAQVTKKESFIIDKVVRPGCAFNISRYNLAGTPCETIYGQESHTCIYGDVMNEIKGDHHEMKRLGITAYLGTAIPVGDRSFILVTLTKEHLDKKAADDYLQLSGIITSVATDLLLRQEGANRMERLPYLVKSLTHALAARDIETMRHSQAVGDLTEAIAKRIAGNPHIEGTETLTDETIQDLRVEAELHDVGKTLIPGSILRKPGQLTEEEFKIMKLHANLTGVILSLFGALHPYVYGAKLHHLRFDGTGYPESINKTLKGTHIPIEARIMAIADVIVALTERRPYREPVALLDICRYLDEQSGKIFDPAIIPVVLQILTENNGKFWNGMKENLLKKKQARVIGTGRLIER